MGESFSRSVVQTVKWKGHQKTIRLADGRSLILPRSACVTTGEVVRTNGTGVYVECAQGLAQLLPIYAARELIKVGALKLEFLIKEITENAEMEAYESLTNFHYRDQPLFGRTARLIIQTFHPNYPRTIGYIELATPFYMSKPRNALLNRPFRTEAITWDRWDKATARRAINVVVRIARCVIYPEFRGLGLGQKLVTHAIAFAKTHWQVGGVIPQFIEISADMLKYVPFAQRAGLHFVGDTEGNLKRVAKDLEYLLGNRRRVKSRQIVREEAFGIVDQQVARMDRATALMKQNGWSRRDFIDRLRRIHRSASLRDLSLLQQVLSLPKPTYLGGLTRQADKFVREGVRLLNPKNGFTSTIPEIRALSRPIELRKLTIVHNSAVRRSRSTSAVQHAFGISPEAITHQVINDLSFSFAPGQVVMIVGPSGSGKTTLLKYLASMRPNVKHVGEIKVPSDYRPGLFEPLRSKRPLIDALHAPNVPSALKLMGLVSLSDAFVYLKRFDELSAGQQYRAMLAKLIAGRFNVWIVDEFGAHLDPIAANCVAHRLGHLARQMNVALIVGTPQPEVTARSLLPDTVVRLTTAWENEVLTGSEFLRRLPKPPLFRVPSYRLSKRAFNRMIGKKKGATLILPGNANVDVGPVVLEANGSALLCNATASGKIEFRQLSASSAKRAGYCSKGAFVRSWRRENPGAAADTKISTLDLVPVGLIPG